MRWLILALALFVTATAHAQVSDSDAAFYRAWYQETALRDFDAAAKAYAALAATPGVPTDLAVKAHLGRARCLMLTGHIDDAQAEYRAAAATDPSNIEAKTALTTPTAAASRDVELMQSINSLLTSASNGDVKSLEQLELLGSRAIPLLREELNGRWPTRVTAAAKALARMGTSESFSGLTQSLSDPNLVSPACVVQALDELPPTAAALDVFEMAQSLKEAKYRTEAVQSLDRWPGVSETAAQARYAEILLRCAHDPSADVRMAMLSGKWPDYGLRPLVAERLKSSDGTQRQQAFVLIQRAWPGSFTEEIRSGCGDPSPDVRMSALICLQNDRLDVSFRRDLAVASLADADARVATLAAQILRKIPGVSWNDALVTAVIRAMTRAFSQLGTIGLWTELKQLHSAREFNGYSSTILTPDLIDLYVATTNPKSEVGSAERVTIRTWILDKVLDQRRDDGHAEEIVAAGFAAIPSAEERAAWLRRWHGWVSSLTGVLATAVGAPEPSVRLEGYRRLLNAARGQGKNISTPPHLAEDLASSDEELRAAALALAANCPDPSLVRPIRAIHDAATGQARASALNALVACGGKDALADVRRDLESDDAETYFAARDFIVSLLGDDAVDDLVRLARRIVDPSVAVSGTGLSRSALARFVSQIPADQLTKGLIECLADRLPDEAAAQLAAITLKSSSPDVQSAGASLAQHRNVRGAIPALLRLLGSSEANVRDAAEGALKSMQRYQELRATFDKFGEGGRDDALAKARSLLKDPSPEKRRGAVLAIAAVGDAGAASLLLDALSDADAGVRSAALQALEKLGAK